MSLEKCRETPPAAGAGLTADAGVDDLDWQAVPGEGRLGERDPALLEGQAISRADTIAQHQQAPLVFGHRSARQQQQQSSGGQPT